MSKKFRLALFITSVLLLSPVLASASSFVNVTLPESKIYNSTNLLLDFKVNGPITSASYSLNNENNVSMNPVLIFSMENITGTTVTDFSPYKNNGQMINNVVYTTNGKYGGALVFDNYDSRVIVPDSSSLEVGNAFTISAWIYPNSTSIWPLHSPEKIIEKTGSYFLDLVMNSTDNTYYINFGFYAQNMCPTGNTSKPLDYCLFMIPSVSRIPMNQWTHVAGTYDGTTMRLFINGVEDNRQEWTSMTVNNITTPITVNKTTSPLLIGSDPTAAYTFNGLIDEVRIYNASLALRSWVSVLNPNFEEPTASDLDPLRTSEYYTNYWRYEPCDEVPTNLICTPHLYWDTSIYRSSNHSMKIVNTNPDDLAWLAQNPNRFKPDVIGGVTYTESVWIKTANMSKASDDGFRLLHLWWNSSWQNFAASYCNYTTKNYTSWTQITCPATAPIGAVKGDFVIELSGPGTVWIDDANFTSNQPMPHWITNGLNNVTVFATSNGVVSSDTKIFTVNQAPTYVNLSLNGAENNTTLIYPQNLTAIFGTNVLTATMYRNGINVSSENGTSIKLGAGYYNYTVVNPGNQNYTSSSKTFFVNVTQATSNCSLTFNPASGSTYPVSLNASCVCTNPEASAVLWRNGTDVTKSENNQIVNLTVGVYNYVCNVSQTQNYTLASNSSSYTISSSPYCGDNSCNNGETCSSCPADCGTCPSNSGGGGGGGGVFILACKENWTCTSWSSCKGGIQTRTCTDLNKCGTNKSKPAESQSCVPEQISAECKENWSCTDWSACVNGKQARTCTDLNKCGTTSNKPTESQSCVIETSTTNEVAADTPTGLFFGLNTSDWIIAIISGIIISLIIIFISRRKEKKKTQS